MPCKTLVNTTTNKYYRDFCEKTFKEPYNIYICSFRNKFCEKNTECFKYLWELKEEVVNQSINYDIALKLQKYVCNSLRWYLCICEKDLILRADAIPFVLLSKRDNLVRNAAIEINLV